LLKAIPRLLPWNSFLSPKDSRRGHPGGRVFELPQNAFAETNSNQIPFWALVSFGSYLLFKLGWGVFTFNDVPNAHAELMEQIKQARTELQAKGVDVGSD